MIYNKDKKRITDLMKAIILLNSPSEAAKFFRDLFTEKELIEFGNRWKAARMLAKNIKYTEIEKETGLSSTTVARVSNWLNKGTGGYKLILKKVNSHQHKSFSLQRKGCVDIF